MTQVQPMRIDENIMKIAELKSQEEHTKKTTALKQFLYSGVEEYLLNLCSKGRISIGKAAEIMQKSVYDMLEIAKKKGIKLGANKEQYINSVNTMNKIIDKL